MELTIKTVPLSEATVVYIEREKLLELLLEMDEEKISPLDHTHKYE